MDTPPKIHTYRGRPTQAWTAKTRVLPFIKDFTKHYGKPPTLNEIALGFSKTREWARLMINYMLKAKLLKTQRTGSRWSYRKHRSIKII